MTQHKDLKAKIRDRMAANDISYTQAARLFDLETGRAPAQVIDCHDLRRRTGVAIEDDNLIRNGVWDRASDQDREECGPCEHYDYEAIEGSRHDTSSAWLASRGAAWVWSMPGSGGTLTVPARKDDEPATRPAGSGSATCPLASATTDQAAPAHSCWAAVLRSGR